MEPYPQFLHEISSYVARSVVVFKRTETSKLSFNIVWKPYIVVLTNYYWKRTALVGFV
jgi:hypothetical protein